MCGARVGKQWQRIILVKKKCGGKGSNTLFWRKTVLYVLGKIDPPLEATSINT